MSTAGAAAFGRVISESPLVAPGMVRQIRAHADRLELAVLRNGSPAGGWFILRESAQRRRGGDGAVVLVVRGDDGALGRPTTIRGGELAALDRAVDLVLGARS